MHDINFGQFFSTDFIFEKNPPFNLGFLYVVGVFILFIAIAFAAWFVLKRKDQKLPLYKKLQSGLFNLFFYTGLAGLALSFFHFQQINYLGSRFFFLVLFIIFIIFLISIIEYRLRTFPRLVKKYYEKKDFEKYLPRKRS